MLALVSVSLIIGCAKKEEGTPIGRSTAPQTPAEAWAQGAGVTFNGVVWRAASAQAIFQDNINGYVDAAAKNPHVGYVSSTASGNTGFYFVARIELQSGVLNTTNTPRVDVRTNSQLVTVIYDEFTDRPDESGQVVPAIRRGFDNVSGYVQGNRAYLKFTDAYGSITLDGTFNGTTYVGTFVYDNTHSATDGVPAAGTIGQFQVPTCQFFRCQ